MDLDSTHGLRAFLATDMTSSEKETQPWSTHDRACAHCRERKIRCGREKPHCVNCKRDGVDCSYSTPGKRINHVKLLCNNVTSLEGRLSKIEGQLSFLTNLLKESISRRTARKTEEEPLITFPADHPVGEDGESQPATDRYHSSVDLIDRYHGPCTLLALCTEFCDITLAEQRGAQPSKLQEKPANDEAIKDLLARMCLEAGIEESFDLPTDHINIRLPPKQFLLMVQSQFFDQLDYMTDIFVRSSFWSNVDRIYCRPLRPTDYAWAICFSTIILLVLGSECFARGNDQVLGSQFLEPFLSTIPAALGNSHILLAPKLINVQALALLSIAAQQYFPPGFAESIFAQACVLARTMGLHRTYSVSDGVGPEEALERFKVLRSLYLRDKSLSISRGSVCWLSSFDCSLSSEFDHTGFADADFSVRIELAQLQEDIYRLFHAPERRRQPFTKHRLALSGIEQRLDRWVNTYGIFNSHESQDIHLQLEFLAARISAFRGSSEPRHVHQALDDARVSCRLLLRSYGNNDPFDTTPFGRTPSSSVGAAAKGETANWESSSNAGREKGFLFHRLLDMFPVTAFFLLAKNLLLPVSVEEESQAVQDINLLQNVCTCYEELDARTQANNYIRKVGRAFKTVLEVVNLIKNSPQHPMSPVPSSTPDIQPNPKKLLSGSHALSSFTGPPTPSAYPLPHLSRDDFLIRSISTGMMEMTSHPASDIGSLLAPATSGQQDPLGQHYFSPQIQSQTEVSRRKRPRLGETDISVGDFRLISDFLGGSPMMPFDGSL